MSKALDILHYIDNQLFLLKDDTYGDFTAKLNPTIQRDTIIGVRNPQVKTLAKELTLHPDRLLFLQQLPHKYLEENMLHGFLLNNSSSDIAEIIRYTEQFLPYIDNWAVCDTTCMSLKIFKKYPTLTFQYAKKWTQSSDIYTIRFGIVILLDYYLDKYYSPEVSKIVANITEENYYVKMAMAWYFSNALIKQYDDTILYFQNDNPEHNGTYKLSKWVHNKSIQKAIESFRVPEERKAILRSMRRK